VDAALSAAPSSTRNKTGELHPEMHDFDKGKPWRFGELTHIAVNAKSNLVHTFITTAANVNDVTQGDAVLRGEELVGIYTGSRDE
jgi:IS5 family transposase